MTVFGTNAVAWAAGAAAAESHLPFWPVYLFGGFALVGLYVLLAALLGWWPLSRLAIPVAELLDDRIRQGQEVRGRIGSEDLSMFAAAALAAGWSIGTAVRLGQRYPALMDEFTQAGTMIHVPIDPDDHNAGNLRDYMNTKLAVLAEARRTLN
jgi:hypothetical protein